MQDKNKPEKLNNSHFRKVLEATGKEVAKLITPEILEILDKENKKSIRQRLAIEEFFDKRKGFISKEVGFDFNGKDFMNFVYENDTPYYLWNEENIIENMVKFIDFERNRLSNLTGIPTPKPPHKAEETGYNLGYSDTQLETLYGKLIGNYLDKNTQLEDFKNSFNGEVLAEGKRLKWIGSKTVLSLFVGLLIHDNKWKIAESVFENCNSRNLAKSFNNCNPDGFPLNKHKPTIKLFKNILH
ncbi:MAG: hypothetical protein V4585_14435 [Bacteroidota bacterium]